MGDFTFYKRVQQWTLPMLWFFWVWHFWWYFFLSEGQFFEDKIFPFGQTLSHLTFPKMGFVFLLSTQEFTFYNVVYCLQNNTCQNAILIIHLLLCEMYKVLSFLYAKKTCCLGLHHRDRHWALFFPPNHHGGSLHAIIKWTITKLIRSAKWSDFFRT